MRGKGEDGVGGLLDSNRRREKISEDARKGEWREASNHIGVIARLYGARHAISIARLVEV